jgi:DNA-binding response OmpR family regulator
VHGRRRGHPELDLSVPEFTLLLVLCEYRGRVQTRAELLKRAWGKSVTVSMRTVDTTIRRLRAN